MTRITKSRKGYKVLRSSGPHYRSAIKDYGESGGIEYRKRVWAKPLPKHGPLCVFKTLRAAISFMNGTLYTDTVCKCEYRPSKEKEVYTSLDDRSPRHLLPAQTCLAEAVRIGRTVYSDFIGITRRK